MCFKCLLPATSRNINEKSYRAATGRLSPVHLDYVTSVALTGGSPKHVLGPVTLCSFFFLITSHPFCPCGLHSTHPLPAKLISAGSLTSGP